MICPKFSRKMMLHEVENFDNRKLRECDPVDRQKLFQDIRSERKIFLNEVGEPRSVFKLRREIESFKPSKLLRNAGKTNNFQSMLQDIRVNQKKYLTNVENRKKLLQEIEDTVGVQLRSRPTRENEYLKRTLMLKEIEKYVVDLRESCTRDRSSLLQKIRDKDYKLRHQRSSKSRRSMLSDIRQKKSHRRLRPRAELMKEIREFNSNEEEDEKKNIQRHRLRRTRTLPRFDFVTHHLNMLRLDGVLFRSWPKHVVPKDRTALLSDIRTRKLPPIEKKEEKIVDDYLSYYEEEECEGEEEEEEEVVEKKRRRRRRRHVIPRNRQRLMSQIRSFCPGRSLMPRSDLLLEIRKFRKSGKMLRPKEFHKCPTRVVHVATERERLDMFDELLGYVGVGLFKGKRNVSTKDRSALLADIRSFRCSTGRSCLKHVETGGMRALFDEVKSSALARKKRALFAQPSSMGRPSSMMKNWTLLRQMIRQKDEKLVEGLKKTTGRVKCRREMMNEIRDFRRQRREAEFWKRECLEELVNGDIVWLRSSNTVVRDPLHRVLLFCELQPMNDFLTYF